MVDARNFTLNTDYAMDKIVFLYENHQSVANNTYSGNILIPHGLLFRPLVKMQWSNTPDFAVTNEHGDDSYYTNIFGTQAGQEYSASSTDTNILISLYNTSGSNKVLYYRVYCFVPSDVSNTVVASATANIGDIFTINTDYNYMKLFHDGTLTALSPSYSHNLGYVPRVLVWQTSGTQTDDYTSGVVTNTGYEYGIHITNTQIVSLNPYADKIHYRIYIDE